MSIDPNTLILAILVVAFASTVQGSVGFGSNLIAAPLLAIIDPGLVPGSIFVASTALTVATAVRERDHVDWSYVGWASIGRVPAVVVGGLVLSVMTDSALGLLVAITIIVAVVLSSGVIRLRESKTMFIIAGAASGFGATSASIGGPPVALSLQHRSGPQVRSTISAFFVIGSTMTIPAIALAGRLGWAQLFTGLALIPGSLLGFVISGPLRAIVDAGRIRPIVLGLSTLSAMALLVKIAL